MSAIADTIFSGVTAAMQPAEDLGGPEGDDYIALMERIADEANSRAIAARINQSGLKELTASEAAADHFAANPGAQIVVVGGKPHRRTF